MLVTENKLSDSDGHVILEPAFGLGYQLIGALQRLGRKALAPKAGVEKEEKLKSFPLRFFERLDDEALRSNAVACCFLTGDNEKELSLNKALSTERFASLVQANKSIAEHNPECHFIWALPVATDPSILQAIHDLPTRNTVFLCPQLFGFRDFNILDLLIDELYKTFPNLEVREQESTYLFSADAASFLLSAIQKEELFGKTVQLPHTSTSLAEITRAFKKYFPERGSSLQKRLGSAFRGKLNIEVGIGRESSSESAINALDVFPTIVHNAERAMQIASRQYGKDPELESHFPPAKSI